MFTLVAVLMFGGALLAAGYAVYSTIMPALPKIQAALTGKNSAPVLPPLSPRRVVTMRVMAQPMAAQPTYWRAAA